MMPRLGWAGMLPPAERSALHDRWESVQSRPWIWPRAVVHDASKCYPAGRLRSVAQCTALALVSMNQSNVRYCCTGPCNWR